MTIKQLSVFLENKPGALKVITDALKDGGIDIRAMTISDTTDYGILRMIVDDPDRAAEVLSKINVTCSQTDVIAVLTPDRVGGLAGIVTILTGAGIGIEYVYAFMNEGRASGVIIFRVSDEKKALTALKEAEIGILTQQEIIPPRAK